MKITITILQIPLYKFSYIIFYAYFHFSQHLFCLNITVLKQITTAENDHSKQCPPLIELQEISFFTPIFSTGVSKHNDSIGLSSFILNFLYSQLSFIFPFASSFWIFLEDT